MPARSLGQVLFAWSVNRYVSVRHAAVTLMLGIGEGHYDDVFDSIVGRLVVLEGAGGGMESIPSCCLVSYVGGKVCVESSKGRVGRGPG